MEFLRVPEIKIRSVTIMLERNQMVALSTTGAETVSEHIPFSGNNVEHNVSSRNLGDVQTCLKK